MSIFQRRLRKRQSSQDFLISYRKCSNETKCSSCIPVWWLTVLFLRWQIGSPQWTIVCRRRHHCRSIGFGALLSLTGSWRTLTYRRHSRITFSWSTDLRRVPSLHNTSIHTWVDHMKTWRFYSHHFHLSHLEQLW